MVGLLAALGLHFLKCLSGRTFLVLRRLRMTRGHVSATTLHTVEPSSIACWDRMNGGQWYGDPNHDSGPARPPTTCHTSPKWMTTMVTTKAKNAGPTIDTAERSKPIAGAAAPKPRATARPVLSSGSTSRQVVTRQTATKAPRIAPGAFVRPRPRVTFCTRDRTANVKAAETVVQVSALAFSASNSAWLMVPASSRALALAICSAGPVVLATCWMYFSWAACCCATAFI